MQACKPLFEYIVGQSDYVQWVAYFTPVTFNLGQTTTNVVEIENWRTKHQQQQPSVLPEACQDAREAQQQNASAHNTT